MEEGKKLSETANFFARRTESVDAAGITSLVQRHTETVFGRVNVEFIIERANLGISLVGSENGEVLAHASLLDYPTPGCSVDPAHWEQWMRENFTDNIRASPINTLFLHLFVAKEGFQQAAIAEILRIVFVAAPLLQYVIITTPTTAGLGSALQKHFSPVPVIEGCSPAYTAHVTHRHQHYPQLYTRTARVEDADDLMSIFTQYAPDMTGEYGEYFLAELIESQDNDHKTLIAEVDGHAVGFISVMTQVDLDLLNPCFQLEAYNNLRHPAPTQQDSGLTSHSVKSIPTSDHLEASSISLTGETADPAKESPAQEHAASSDSQTKLASTSSLARLAQIAQMTSSKSSLTQSKSKLTTHSTQSKTRVADTNSKTTVAEDKTKKIDSETKGVDSKTKMANSKAKVSPSKSTLTSSQAQVKSEVSHSTSSAKTSQEPAAAESRETGLPSSNAGQSQISTTADGEEGAADSLTEKSDGVERRCEGEEQRAQRLAGKSSAVAIQLFAIQDQYEMRSIDLLVAVFQAFPDHDFCVLSLPHTIPEFPLLSHFTRVPPRVHSTLPQELYVMHKCSLLHSFAVRQATTSDLSGVKDLVDSLEGSECVMRDVVRGVEGGRDGMKEGATPLAAMVAECAGQIVGVAIIRREEELLFLRSHYNIEDFVYLSHHRPEEHGRLHHLLLSPAFSPLTKHFMKEVLRQCHMTSLYYPFHPLLLPPSLPHKPHTITTALSEMVPVRGRRQVVYPNKEVLGVNQPLPQVLEERDNLFTLFHINRKLTLEPKCAVNSRVVVVGASDTALSLLETLVFSPHLAFNNLVLVSPAGLTSPSLPTAGLTSPSLPTAGLSSPSPPTAGLSSPSPSTAGLTSPSPSTASCPSPPLPSSCCYWPASLPQMGLSAWLHTVQGSMVAINREEKEVIVWSEGGGEEEEEGGEESVVPYDHLILCTGLQFTQPPDHGGETPLIYNVTEGLGVSEWAQKYLQSEDHILLYGSTIEAYTALQALLAGGVAPALITFVRPHPSTACFNNAIVEQRVQRSLEEAGVVLLTGHTLSEVQEGGVCLVTEEEEEGGVCLVTEEEEEEEGESNAVFIECQAVICMSDRQVSPQVFTALNDACVVFDKRLVIDTHYQTNDPAIMAAGPMTKFSRQFYSDQWTHANFNSKEVGEKLAATLLSKLDPTLQEPDVTSDPDPLLLPTYTQPKAVYTLLPGGLHYLHVEKPNLSEPLDSLMNQTNYGQELVTDTENGYFRIHINQYSRVQTITVLSDKAFETTNYMCLYDMHEKYLNNMSSRFEEGLISDFFLYFRELWSCAVFHDRFPDLRDEILELLSQQPLKSDEDGGMSMEQRVRELLGDQQTVSLEGQKERLLSEFSSSPAKPSSQQLLHRYLHYNHYHLPMYAHPDII